jgi:hypothetical protein
VGFRVWRLLLKVLSTVRSPAINASFFAEVQAFQLPFTPHRTFKSLVLF